MPPTCFDVLRRRIAQLGILCLLLLTSACAVSALPVATDGYSYKTPSADGIGKIYYGREIAQVMGYQGASWLARPSRFTEERPDSAIDALNLQPTDVVADIGAGSGVISFELASWVPQGKVVAVDVQPEMLALIEAARDGGAVKGNRKGLKNIETVLGEERDPHLQPESLDMAVMFDAYHEFAYPKEMMAAIVRALKPGGQVVLAEYRAENPLVLIKAHHKMSEAQVKKELAAAGLTWRKTDERLPQQHLIFFQKPA